MYPILMRLDRGLLETTWEVDPPPGRPPRHLYRLTTQGLELSAQLAPEATPATGVLARLPARGAT